MEPKIFIYEFVPFFYFYSYEIRVLQLSLLNGYNPNSFALMLTVAKLK